MTELRVTVSFGRDNVVDDRAAVLDELAAHLSAAVPAERLARVAGLGQQSGPPPVFVLTLADEEIGEALRRVAGWYMRHPSLTLTLRLDTGNGGGTLQLKEFSSIAFAQVAARLAEIAAASREGADGPGET